MTVKHTHAPTKTHRTRTAHALAHTPHSLIHSLKLQVKEDIARLARGSTTVASMHSMSVASRNDCSLDASVSSQGAGGPMSNHIQPCPSSVDPSLPTPPQERQGEQAKARGGVGVGASPRSGRWAVRSSRGAAGAEELGQGRRTDWCRDLLGRFVVEDGLGRMVRANGGSEQGCRGGESTGRVSVSGSVTQIDEDGADRERGSAVAVAAAPAADTDAGEQQGRTTYSNLSGAPKPPPFQRAMSSESADASFRRVASLSRHITGAPPYAYTGRQREVAFKVYADPGTLLLDLPTLCVAVLPAGKRCVYTDSSMWLGRCGTSGSSRPCASLLQGGPPGGVSCGVTRRP